MTKILCKGQHWEVKDGQLILSTPEGHEILKSVVETLEAQIRLKIYDEICSIPLTDNRTQLVKQGIDNVALTVQDLCAQVALGKKQ